MLGLSPSEETDYKEKCQRIREQARLDAEMVRVQYVAEQVEMLVKSGSDQEQAEQIVKDRLSGTLHLDDYLSFDDGRIPRVRDVLAYPAAYDKCSLKDPQEPEAGRCKAKFFANFDTGKPVIYSQLHGGKSYFFDISSTAFLEQKHSRVLSFTPLSELLSYQAHTQWLIKGYLERETTTTIYSPPESFKTFIILDIGMSIATGTPWHGHNVTQGPVLYFCGEGRKGIRRRVKAWLQHNAIGQDAPFFVSNRPAQLLASGNVQEIMEAVEEISERYGKPALIIIDTLNRNFGPGDENKTLDMTLFISALDRLRISLGCAICVIHHTGLTETERGRGSSALRGAMDFEYMIKKTPGEPNIIELIAAKTKDHDRPPTLAFKPVIVNLEGETDEDGFPVTSLVLEATNAPQRQRTRLPFAQQVALAALRAIQHPIPGGGVGSNIEDWRNEAYAQGISKADTPEARQKAFSRAVTELQKKGEVLTRDDLYWTS